MKKIFTLTLSAFFLIVATATAQTKFGVKAGLNSSSWKGNAVSNLNDLVEFADGYVVTKGRTGFHAGGFVQIPLSEVFSIEPGVYYSQKGYSLEGNMQIGKLDFLSASATADVQSHYIDVPVLVKANIAKGLQLFAGPQVSYLAKNNLRVQAGALGFNVFKRDMDITKQFNELDVALVGGIGYQFDNGFSINAAYDHGLSRLDKNSNFESYNRVFKIGVGFAF